VAECETTMAESAAPSRKHSVLRSLGLGLITGAADDDCSAIGTYAQAGAQLGYRALWIAPALLPMMVTVVYLSGKLGLVTGQGLFSVLRSHSSRWLLYLILTGVLIGNMIEAGADIGAMAAAFGILVHVPRWLLILSVSAAALAFQVWGSYGLIRNVLRGLALVLLTYVASAFLAHPKLFRGGARNICTLPPLRPGLSCHSGRDDWNFALSLPVYLAVQ
jgi:Mn2+/Fe2+ NRAMP family transporter